MFLHPAIFLFFIILLLSIISMISVTSWFSAWLILEINMMSFIPIMLKKKSKYSTESILKYFLIQSFSSILLILMASFALASFNTNWVIMLLLLLKIGMAPFHQWVVSMVDGLTWDSLMILFTLQKINPLFLIAIITKTNKIFNLMLIFILISAILGSVGGLSQSSLPKILTFSSISHLAWISTLIMLNSWSWLVYFLLYLLLLLPVTTLLHKNQVFTLTSLYTLPNFFMVFSLSLYLLSFAGMPPFTGFIPKFISIKVILSAEMGMIMLALLMSTFISLFFYLRLSLANMLLSYNLNMNFSKAKTMFNDLTLLLLMLFLPSMLFIFL